MLGTLLKDRYRIEAALGEGGMGVVYRAHDTLLDRPVAIKTLSPHLLGEEGLRRLLREAQAAARLNHPHIVAVHDVLDDGGTAAIVMEYVEGQTLRDLVPVPLERLVGLTDQLLDALGYAHTQGIVHRDIKPENVLVRGDGQVKVTDFGLARSEGRSRLTQTGMVVGTVAYMAPEQALGGAIDARTDLYAVGCVLYEAVTGHRPFESEDPISVISQHVNVPPIAPRWHNPELPADWEGFILKLMAKDPAERYGSVAEARRTLQDLRPTTLEEGEVAPGEAPAVTALLGTVRRGRLVGRDAELRQLKGYIDLAISGQGQVVFLAGEPGIGKTRLSREGLVYARLRGARVLSGACYESEATVPYLPFVEALRGYVRSRPAADIPTEVGDAGPELIKLLPELAELIPGLRPSPPLEAAQERLRLFDGITDFLVRLSRAAPVLLFLDDLHWADGTSLHLLTHLARRLRGERIIVLGTYRDVELDREHPLADVLREMNRERLYQRILLRRLDREGVRALIGAMFSVEQVSDEFTDLIYRETEGNPFFLEEVLKHLVETGAMYREKGRWQRKGIAEIEIPQSVKEVIGRRLEQVSDPCRQTLTLAAVIGRRFDFDVLVRTAEGREDQTLDALEEAMRSQLLREEKVGGAVLYDFAHALIRETLYDGLSLRRRMRLHQRVGEALEEAYRKDPDPVVEDLAFHFAQAPHGESAEKAITYARRAAEKALRLYATGEAVKFFAEAVELLREAGRDAEAADVLEEMGEPVWLATSDPRQAVRRHEEALAFHERAGNRLRVAELRRKIGRILHLGFAYAEAIPHLRSALEVLEAEGTPQDVTRTLLDLARAQQFSGDAAGAEANGERARAIAAEHGFQAEEALAWSELGLVAQFSGDWAKAEAAYQRAIELAQSQDSRGMAGQALTRSLNNLGGMAEVRGQYEKARSTYERLLARALERGNHPIATRQRWNLAYLDIEQGDWPSARRYLQEILDPDTHGDPYWRSAADTFLAWLDGEWERAITLLLQDMEQARRDADVQGQLGLLQWLIRGALDLEDHERATEWSTEAVRISEAQGTQRLIGAETTAWALIALALAGRREEAATLLERQEARLKLIEVERGYITNALARAALLEREGQADEADAAFSDALSRLTRTEAHMLAAWVQWLYGRLLLTSAAPARRAKGRTLLTDAQRTFEEIGGARYVAEIRTRLDAPPTNP